MQILISLAIGALCGWLAGQFMGSKNNGLIINIILGIVGGALEEHATKHVVNLDVGGNVAEVNQMYCKFVAERIRINIHVGVA